MGRVFSIKSRDLLTLEMSALNGYISTLLQHVYAVFMFTGIYLEASDRRRTAMQDRRWIAIL